MNFKRILENVKAQSDEKLREELYGTADTVNYEGGIAWQRKGLELLEEILMLGYTGNTFYVNEEKALKENLGYIEDVIMNASDEELARVAEIIVKARNEGYWRTLPLIALAFLRKRSPKYFRKIFHEVALTPQDVTDFMEITRALGMGFGRAVKDAMNYWLREISVFRAVKYRKRIADVIRVARPKVDSYPNGIVLQYAYSVYRKDKMPSMEELKVHAPQAYYAELFKKYVTSGNMKKAIEVMYEGRLPADLAIGMAGNTDDREFWEAVAAQMGTMQLLKYVNKLLRALGEEKALEIIKKRITPENLSKAKVFPYRVFVAMLNASELSVKRYLSSIIDKYVSLYDFSAWAGKWLIAPDVSASMTRAVSGADLRAIDVAGFFAGVLGVALDADIVPWDTKVYPDMLTGYNTPSAVYRRLSEKRGGGTFMEMPVRWALERNKSYDYVVIITDSEEFGEGVYAEWVKYKKKNPGAKLVVIQTVGYHHSPFDPEKKEKYDIYEIFGWSDVVFSYIEKKVL